MRLAFSNTARRFPSPLNTQRVIAFSVLSIYVMCLRTFKVFAVNATPSYAKVKRPIVNRNRVSNTATS